MSTFTKHALGLTALSSLLALAGCAYGQKKIAPKLVYRASYLASTDGSNYLPFQDLLELGEQAKPSCRAVDRKAQTKAQYLVERKQQQIRISVKDCESPNASNCSKLAECLTKRPVAWLARASGRSKDQSGTIYTDWLGRCGGSIAVNFYYGPQTPLPLEKVGCSEPQHDAIDTAYEMFLVPRLDIETLPAAAPYIELLLNKWNAIVFHELDSVPPL